MCPEIPDLVVARAVLIEIVEAGLSDAHDLRVRGMSDELTGFVDGFLGCLMRMNADRAPDVWMSLGHGPHARESIKTRADRQHAANACGPRAVHHCREFAAEFRVIEMTVTVDDHFATVSGFPGGFY